MECFGTTDFDNNSRLITLSEIIISDLHCIYIYIYIYIYSFLRPVPSCVLGTVQVLCSVHLTVTLLSVFHDPILGLRDDERIRKSVSRYSKSLRGHGLSLKYCEISD